MLLDGGGCLEEDFALLWHRLAAGATIIIDDIDGRISIDRSWRAARINQKHIISKLLAERFVEAGMLVPGERIISTGWYRKGEAAPSPDAIRLMALPAYHRLIRAAVGSVELGLIRALLRRVAVRAPGLRNFYRRIRPAN